MCCFLADGFCSKGKINERRLLNAGVIIFMKEQVQFKVIKNNERDGITKSKHFDAKVVHARYEARAIFNNKTINFREHDDKFRVTYATIDFHEKINFPKSRVEYSDDFIAQNNDLIILRFKYKNKQRNFNFLPYPPFSFFSGKKNSTEAGMVSLPRINQR